MEKEFTIWTVVRKEGHYYTLANEKNEIQEFMKMGALEDLDVDKKVVVRYKNGIRAIVSRAADNAKIK